APGVLRNDRVALARRAHRTARRQPARARFGLALVESQQLRHRRASIVREMPAKALRQLRRERRAQLRLELRTPRRVAAQQRVLLLGETRGDRDGRNTLRGARWRSGDDREM